MTAAILQALAGHWRRNPLQLFTLFCGLVLATALWCAVQAVNAEARASYDAAAATLGEGRFDQLLPKTGETIPQQRFVELRRAGWLVSPVVDGTLRLPDGGRLRVVGLDPLTAPGGLGSVGQSGGPDLASFLEDQPVFVNAETDARLSDVETPSRIIDEGIAPGTAMADIGVAQRWLGLDGITRLIVAPEQPVGLLPLSEVAPDLTLQATQTGSDIGRLTDSFHLNLTAFGLLSFAVGIFIVHGAIGLAVEQRRPMLRTLRAMGVPLPRLMVLMALELTTLSLMGGVVGLGLGYVVAAALLPDVAATLQGLYGAQVSGTLQLRPGWIWPGLGMALGGTAVAATGAFWQIAKMPLLASAQPRAWTMARGKARRLQALVSAALLLACALLIAFGSGLIAGFTMLACLLIGAALALPLLLSGVLQLCESLSKSALWQWFWADTRQQLPGLSLALMALLLAMAANVGVSTMVSSFRLTFTGFLDQRLAAELYVRSEDPAALEAFAAPRTRELLPLLSIDTTLVGLPGALFGARVGETYRQNWQFLDQNAAAWDVVAQSDGVLINEQLARRADLWVGDPLQVAPDVELVIAGVFGDYGNPIGQAIISEALFKSLHPNVQAVSFGMRTEDPAQLRDALINEFGLSESQIMDQASIKAFSLEVFERTFTVTRALNVLTLSVAGFAMLMSLLTLAGMRLPQLAPAWALGLTQAQLGRLETVRALTLAALTAVCALPLGLALAWVLLAVVNVEAFGWRLPMFIFPVDYARLGLFALVAALLAAAWPAWRLARTAPADLLKVFAHER